MLDPQSEVATTYRHKLAGKHGNHLVRVGRAEDRPNVGEYIVVEEAQPHVVQQCGLVQIPESDHIVRGFQVRLVHGHEDGVGSRRAVLLLNHPCCQGMRAWREAGGGGGEGRGGGGGGARGEGRGARQTMPAAAFSPKVSSSSTEMVPLPPSVTFAGSQVSDSWLYHTHDPCRHHSSTRGQGTTLRETRT
eukprot:COSAG03_NODE_34_length_17821_cov_18.833531_21_plen_190_part_00